MKKLTRSQVKKLGIAGLMALGLSMAQAQAAIASAVSTTISNAGADAAVLGGLMLAFLVGISIFVTLRSAK